METITVDCPSCGAFVHLGERANATTCPYCGSPVTRVSATAAGASTHMELGRRSLIAGNYEVADFHFSTALGENPQDREAWLCKAVAMALKLHGDPHEAVSFLQASTLTTEEAVDYLSELTKTNPKLAEDFLRRQDDLSGEASAVGKILFDAALRHIGDPAVLAAMANEAWTEGRAEQAVLYTKKALRLIGDPAVLTAMADEAWTEGRADQAVLYMKKALQLDPNSRSRNLWLLEVATEELSEEPERSTANADRGPR